MISASRATTRTGDSTSPPPASTGARAVAWFVDVAIVAGLFSGLWLFGLIRISGCEGFDTANNAFPPGCPFESTREVDGEIVYVLDSGRELPADHPTIEPPLLGIRVVDPPGASAYLITLAYTLVVFVLAQGVMGATPGKWLAGIRLADEAGEPLGVARAGIRWLVPDGAIAAIGLLAALVGAPWALRLLAADGVVRAVNSLVGLLSGTGRGPGDTMAGSMVVAAADFAPPSEDEEVDEAEAPPAQAPAGSAWATSAWHPPAPSGPAPSGPPTAEQPVVPSAGRGAEAQAPSEATSTPWAMPAQWPEPGAAPSPATGANQPSPAGEQEGGLRFPWLPGQGAETAEAADEGWVAPTMEPPVPDAEDEAPPQRPDEIVGSATPEPHLVEEGAVADVPTGPARSAPPGGGAAPGGPIPLPAVAPSAAPPDTPAAAPTAEPGVELPAVAPSAMPAGPAEEPTGVAPSAAPGGAAPPGAAATPLGAGPGGGGAAQADWPAAQPIWDPARQAYIYWDPAKDEWLQFDYGKGAWGPISRAG